METQKQQGQIRQWLQAFVLVGLGLYLLYDMLSGRITLYVNNVQFGWVPWLGTVLFLLIGGIQVVDLVQANTKQRLQKHDEHEIHNHGPDEVCKNCDHDHTGHDHANHDEHNHSHAPSISSRVAGNRPSAACSRGIRPASADINFFTNPFCS